MRRAFLEADRNGSGTLNFREFTEFVWEKNRSTGMTKIMKSFANITTDEISFNDFEKMVAGSGSEILMPILDDEIEKGTDSILDDFEGRLKKVYDDTEADELATYIRERWDKFATFRRIGQTGSVENSNRAGYIRTAQQEIVSLLFRHGIQDFTYENGYLEKYVTTGNGGSGLEKHDFSHLDCHLTEDSGLFILAKYMDNGEFHITAFRLPVRHTLYVPGGVIHSNDYLKGTWRTMLSDETDIDHVHLTQVAAEGIEQNFNFRDGKFIETHLKLLDLERETEIEETRILTEKLPPKELQRRGVCLLKLRISGRKTGLYGRTILSFEASGGIKEFPSHNITSGDIVGLCPSSSDQQTDSAGSGIITRVSQTEINVAFDDSQDLFSLDDDSLYKLTKLANDVTYKRIKNALNRLSQGHSQPCSHLASVLFQESELSPPLESKSVRFRNHSQPFQPPSICIIPGIRVIFSFRKQRKAKVRSFSAMQPPSICIIQESELSPPLESKGIRVVSSFRKQSQGHSQPCSHLASVLFQESELSSPLESKGKESELSPPLESKEIYYINSNLDESQKEAVRFALSQPEIAVVHGPPGTGKTTTIIEIIIQAVKQGKKILACAPSNIAVDNLVERLAANKQKIVRLGHPARVLKHIQKYSLDAILSTSDDTRLVEDVRSDMDKAMSKLKKTRDKGERQRLRQDMKSLRKELVQREQTAIKQILKKADVVLATMTGASADGPLKLLDDKHFDLGVIDECSQAIEAACWIPLLKVPRCILAGDHLQLPPTILSNEAAKSGLEMTLMERVLGLYDNQIMRMLTTQYRMNQVIMQWSSDQLYDGKLVAHPSVSDHLLRDIQGITDNEETSEPLLLIDTAGCEMYELDLPEEISKGNEGEADIVATHVEKLISYGLKQDDIAVIAPYNLQVELLRLRLSSNYPKVEVKSVDGFQGREKEAVVISLVRSNPKGEVGFLAEKRRINVAITRARRHLMVVCDSETVGHDKFLKSLVEYMTCNGEVQTAHQYIEEGVVNAKLLRPDHLSDLLSVKITTQKGQKGQKDQGAKPKQKQKPKQNEKPAPRGQLKGHGDNDVSKRTVERDEAILLKKTQEYQEHLDKFVKDPSQEIMEFPASLNSYDRLIIHELSEKLGLVHVSRGIDKERHLVVSKPGIKFIEEKDLSEKQQTKEQEEIPTSTHLGEIKSQREATPTNNDKLICQHCSKDVIRANHSLHEIHCARRQKEATQSASSDKNRKESAKNRPENQKKPPTTTKNMKSNAEKEVIAKLQNVDPDDFDALIASTKELDSKCNFTKCKVKTLTLGHTCEFCQRRFCLNHSMAEVHGCGDAVKAHARATIIKEGVLYRGSGVPSKLPDAKQKALLQKKMDKKRSEMEADRQKKEKSK
ncbi:IGHMBP2 [Mytilus edulis]|uniref:IGHMBP2 n=1 Tax=Mytilus edulis TaxID=6550 RepID=A0A8S3V183_MYTED|nr:IGHMBP2 [Mytilus edulis]